MEELIDSVRNQVILVYKAFVWYIEANTKTAFSFLFRFMTRVSDNLINNMLIKSVSSKTHKIQTHWNMIIFRYYQLMDRLCKLEVVL